MRGAVARMLASRALGVADLEGKDWRSFVHPDDHESLLAAMQRSNASKSAAIRVVG